MAVSENQRSPADAPLFRRRGMGGSSARAAQKLPAVHRGSRRAPKPERKDARRHQTAREHLERKSPIAADALERHGRRADDNGGRMLRPRRHTGSPGARSVSSGEDRRSRHVGVPGKLKTGHRDHLTDRHPPRHSRRRLGLRWPASPSMPSTAMATDRSVRRRRPSPRRGEARLVRGQVQRGPRGSPSGDRSGPSDCWPRWAQIMSADQRAGVAHRVLAHGLYGQLA
jgi:hypothetical protein